MVNRDTYFGHYTGYDLSRLSGVKAEYRSGRARGERQRFNCVYLMADTETSKTCVFDENGHRVNLVCAWSVALRYEGRNVFVVYGRKPSELCDFLLKLHKSMPGRNTICYWHNLSFDWQFIRKFCFSAWGFPCRQLNTKSHYPINIEFNNGIIFRDSLILSQVSLEKWGEQMNAEHAKAVGKWDYDRYRNQDTPFSDDELLYIYNDVLCGVECLNTLAERLNKKPYNLPWTATGIVREMTRKRAKPNKGHERFKKTAFSYADYLQCERTYHGAFTHANRFIVNKKITGDIRCYDFASSYPFVMVSEKFPSEKFMHCPNTSIDGIMRYKNDYAFLFKFSAFGVKLRKHHTEMPYLQTSKCDKTINAIFDNGRILEADFVSIWLTEVDLEILQLQYTFEKHICSDVMFAKKGYLPRWFSDLVFELYELKCKLKYGDKTDYALSKARVNSIYGMCCQKLLKRTIEENYNTGDFSELPFSDPEELYNKEIAKWGHVLPFQIGVWVTAYACKNLFDLGDCCVEWLYSDTDSVYCRGIDLEKLNKYNQTALEKLRANGYDIIDIDGHKFQLGEAATDGEYTEFLTVGAKRYAKRDKNGKLSITVSGVPKAGVKCLNNDISNFRKGLIFDGLTTGKLAHFYSYVDEIYTDENGNEIGDYVDLDPCDYLLDDIFTNQEILYESIGVAVYG